MFCDIMDIQEVLCEPKDLADDINDSHIEIKEVYIADYLNPEEKTDYLDDSSALVNEEITESVLQPECEDNISLVEQTNAEDIQISQIVESSNVSLR